MMEETCLEEIETARRTLLENCDNLEQIANYCEDNYIQAKDKRGALQETKNFTTQSLASVAYQINTLATSMLQMLDCTASKIGDMDSSMNQINLTIDLNNERISRQTIKNSLMTPKDFIRSHKIIKPDTLSSNNNKVKYMSLPIDYGSLDDVGHGLKLGLPSSSPRASRSGSMTSISSRGSPQGSVRQKSSKRSIRSPLSIPSIPSPAPSSNSLQPPVFTEPTNLDDSLNTYSSVGVPPPPSPPPPSPPQPPQGTERGCLIPPGPVSPGMGVGMMAEDQAILPPSPLPPPPPPEVDGGMSSDDLPPPPRPTSLMLQSPRSTSLSPRSTSPNPQQHFSSSPMANGSTNHLHIPGDEQRSSRSPGKTRKATVSRKASRSPRPINRPPPPPSAEGHTMSSDVSNPLYLSTPVAPPPPPAPAPTPSGGPPTPPGGGSAPPPPPPPPPIGGMGAKKPASSNKQEYSAQAVHKNQPAQATVSFADQLKQRLAKLESKEVAGEEQGLDTRETRELDEPNNNIQTIDGLPPSTAEARPGLAADPGPVESEMENVSRTGFTSPETTEWPPTEFLWKGVALFDYTAMREDEMTFQQGDVIYLIHDFQDGWLVGLCNGVRAMVPGNYLEPGENYV